MSSIIERILEKTVADEITLVAQELNQVIAEAARHGMTRSSRAVVNVRTACASGMTRICEKIAALALKYTDHDTAESIRLIEPALKSAHPKIMELFHSRGRQTGVGGPDDPFHVTQRSELERELNDTITHVLDRVECGLLDMGAVPQSSVTVTDSPGVVIGSNNQNATQVGNDNVLNQTSGIDVAGIIAALAQFKSVCDGEDLSEEAREEIGDAVINIEREIESQERNAGRVQRLALKLKELASDTAVGVAGNALFHAILQALPSA